MHSQHVGQGSPSSAASQIITPQWQQQLLKYEVRQLPCVDRDVGKLKL